MSCGSESCSVSVNLARPAGSASMVCLSRGLGHFPGWWWMATIGRHAGYESWLERDQVRAIDFDRDVIGLASQPLWAALGERARAATATRSGLLRPASGRDRSGGRRARCQQVGPRTTVPSRPEPHACPAPPRTTRRPPRPGVSASATRPTPASWSTPPYQTEQLLQRDRPDSTTHGATTSKRASCAFQLNPVRGLSDTIGLTFGVVARGDHHDAASCSTGERSLSARDRHTAARGP